MEFSGNRLSDRFDSTLKLFCTASSVSEILHNRLEDRVQILLARAAAAHLRDAEDRAAGFPRAVEVAVVVFRLNIERRLA